MRIAFISTMEGAPWGGSEYLWSAAALRALQEGHQVFFDTARWPEVHPTLQGLLAKGAVACFRTPYKHQLHHRIAGKLGNLPHKYTRELSRLIHFRPDVLVISQGAAFDIGTERQVLQFLKETDIPFLIICHSYHVGQVLPKEMRQDLAVVYLKAKQLLVISNSQAEIMQQQLAYQLPNISLVANPLNIAVPEAMPFPAGDRAAFAMIGLLSAPVKRQDLVIRLLSGDSWKKRDWILNIYGTGPDGAYLEELAKEHKINGQVIFHGHEGDVKSIWKVNELLLVASPIETGPMVLAEAMACGRPAVATPVGNVTSLIIHGTNGWISRDFDETAFAFALEEAWQKRVHWSQAGVAAYCSALNKLDMDAAGTFLSIIGKAAS